MTASLGESEIQRRTLTLLGNGGLKLRLFFCPQKQTPCLREQTGGLEFNLDDDLLSHGETPHYHRRCIVS
ncbi:hypothetical protein, partial [Pseudomonas fragi]